MFLVWKLQKLWGATAKKSMDMVEIFQKSPNVYYKYGSQMFLSIWLTNFAQFKQLEKKRNSQLTQNSFFFFSVYQLKKKYITNIYWFEISENIDDFITDSTKGDYKGTYSSLDPTTLCKISKLKMPSLMCYGGLWLLECNGTNANLKSYYS